MSTNYTAVLFYGFKINKKLSKKIEEQDWEDWLANILKVKLYSQDYKQMVSSLSITVVTKWAWDDQEQYLALARTVTYADYRPTVFEMDAISSEEVARMKEDCERLGIPFHKPQWILFVNAE